MNIGVWLVFVVVVSMGLVFLGVDLVNFLSHNRRPRKQVSRYADFYPSLHDEEIDRRVDRQREKAHRITLHPAVPQIDWVQALELNTTAWRITEPDGEAEFVTTDVGIAIDSVEWGSTVEQVRP